MTGTDTVTVNGHTATVATIADVAVTLGFLSLAACALYFAFIILRSFVGHASRLCAAALSLAGGLSVWGAVDTVVELVDRLAR